MYRAHIQSRIRSKVGKLLAELAIGVGMAIMAVAARALLVPITGPSVPFALNFVAAVIATLLAGWRAGVVAVVTSQLLAWFVVMEPGMNFQLPNMEEGAAIALGTAAGLFIVAIIAWYQLNVDQAWAERSREHELRGVLLFELKHRVKNTLTLVQSIAQQTFRNQGVEELAQTFQGRLQALGQTHDLLTQCEWAGAEIRQIVEQSIRPLMPHTARVTADGPPLVLTPKACLNVAMVFHELTTNSLKYGALSNRSGRVSIKWSNEPSSGFMMLWQEAGGPPAHPPKRRGFGTRLIERCMASELGAVMHMRFEEAGFSCSFEGPYVAQPPSQSPI